MLHSKDSTLGFPCKVRMFLWREESGVGSGKSPHKGTNTSVCYRGERVAPGLFSDVGERRLQDQSIRRTSCNQRAKIKYKYKGCVGVCLCVCQTSVTQSSHQVGGNSGRIKRHRELISVVCGDNFGSLQILVLHIRSGFLQGYSYKVCVCLTLSPENVPRCKAAFCCSVDVSTNHTWTEHLKSSLLLMESRQNPPNLGMTHKHTHARTHTRVTSSTAPTHRKQPSVISLIGQLIRGCFACSSGDRSWCLPTLKTSMTWWSNLITS